MDPTHVAAAALLLVVLLLTRARWPARSLLDTFGAGFLPYQADTGWPRGIQEEEPRRWGSAPVSAGDDPGPADDVAELDVPIEDVSRVTVRRR